jgi:hypothetical protein
MIVIACGLDRKLTPRAKDVQVRLYTGQMRNNLKWTAFGVFPVLLADAAILYLAFDSPWWWCGSNPFTFYLSLLTIVCIGMSVILCSVGLSFVLIDGRRRSPSRRGSAILYTALGIFVTATISFFVLNGIYKHAFENKILNPATPRCPYIYSLM